MLVRNFIAIACCALLSIPHSQAEWSGQCVTTNDLYKLSPQVVSTPILFWRAKVKKELALVMVKVPETDELLLNIVECVRAEIREHKPGSKENTQRGDDGNDGKCVPLGNLWVPLANIAEASAEETVTSFNEDHPTEYFSRRISLHLKTYADSMRFDPLISEAISGIDNSFLSVVGLSVYYTSTVHMVPKSFWQKIGRRGLQGIGLLFFIRQGYLAINGGESEFVAARNERSVHLENLIHQIDEKIALRLDGQDEGRNLEENDGYSALVNSISKANNDTYEKFCHTEN